MSKKAPVNKTRKSKRRLKRSVRRSIAALLMITAIGVAAIPVPENFAEEVDPNPSPETPVTPSEEPAPAAYDYSVGEAKVNTETGATEYDITTKDKTCQNSVTNPSLNDDSVPAYKILEGGSGYPRLIWQFEFYKVYDAADNNEYGIISRYNSKHIQSTIEIEASIVTDYVRVEYSDYADWYANADADEAAGHPAGWKGHNDDTYTCTDPNLATSGVTFLKKYFSADFEAHAKAWDEWNKSEDKIADEEPKLTRRVGGDTDVPGASVATNALTEEQKREYYCENETVEIRKGDIRSLEGYTLVQVIDESDPKKEYGDDSTSGDKNDQYVYIPRRINMNEGDKRNDDANGYLAKGFTSINGIGDKVFQGVGNVTRLVTDEQYPLKYIGVSAFEGSYLQSIDIRNVKNISDRAFKNCTNLTEIEMGAENSVIGTEAFYGTYLREIKFGSQVTKIGPGAFAACPAMQKVDFSQVKRSVDIGKYAFYNTSSLSSVIFMASGTDTTQEDFEKPEAAATVSISSIGDGAFAAKPVSSAMTNFTFPSTIQRQISSGNAQGLGDCVLAGRSGLQRVTMPGEFGQLSDAVVPPNTFYFCFNLECVKFPDNGDNTCSGAEYDSDKLFASVNTDGFYVRGPKLARGGRNAAAPRKATWKAKTAVSDVVPYLYYEKGVKYYEVSNGTYLLCINDAGYLTSCSIAEDASFDPTKDNELVIPAKVGTTKVVGIIENCIWDPRLSENITKLTIEDDSISEVSASVFKDWKKLKSAYIGNSITKIGDEAFKGCDKLVDVTFNTPKDYNYASFTIGKDAFVTGSSQLTFHGDIVKGYAPFDWAMDKTNIINKDEVIDKTNEKAGTRVCYKSLAPTYLTVMYNPYTDLVTLLDYPKYDELSDLLAAAHSEEIEYYGCTREDKPYERMMEQKYYLQYGDRGNDIYEGYRRSFANLWQNAGDSRNPDELYSSEFYGPWINSTFCANDGSEGSWKTYITSAGESSKNVLIDWLFEPIVAYAADDDISTGMLPYFTKYPYSVTGGRNAYVPTTPEESSLILATEEILVPNGVGSIDVAGYYNNIDPATGKTDEATKYNSINISKYLQDSLDNDIKRMYFGSAADNKSDDVVPGLFSGYYNDGIGEDDPRGNDKVRRVVLESVQYLPDYAFDNCENLELVSIGGACSDIGSAPFRGCIALTNVNFNNNPKYDSANGIIYELNTPGAADSSLKIVECLAARGGSPADGDRAGVGDTIINSEKDPLITRVSAISEGAFEDCGHVVRVILSDSNNLHEVPERAFRNCKNLREVRLPDTVNSIKRDAFEKDTPLEVTIPGKEVFIATDAFDPKNKTVVIRTYKDTSAYEYADYYDMGIDIISDRWRVKFIDSDGTQIGDAIYVEDTYPVPPASVPADPEGKMGYEFAGWKGWNGKVSVEIGDAITADTDFVAQYNSQDGMANGKYIVEFYTVFGDKVGETLYIEPGSDIPQDKIPNPPVYDGYVFDQWIPATFTNIQKSTTYIAGYKNADGSNATNPGGNTSGNSTNNDGNGGNGGNGNGSNGSTISQLYPTSGTSTSSGAVGKYTVTVVNGSGSGTYDAGSTVIIAANTPASGKVFSKWTTESQGVTLASVSMSATTFVMPAANVTVTANYVDGIGANTVGGTVNNGNTLNRVPATVNNGNTTVSITKPGISNKDLATANVNGSTDNFVVKISETDEATQAVINALTNKYGNMDSILYYAMDISLYDSTGTVKINDTTGLSVDITIPIPDALTVFGGNNMAGAVVSNQLEDLSERFTTINGVPCISFTATHFSPYTIYVNTQNLSEGMLDVTPKTGDPIHPKWFLSLGLACLSIIMFMKKDKKPVKVKAA